MIILERKINNILCIDIEGSSVELTALARLIELKAECTIDADCAFRSHDGLVTVNILCADYIK